MDIAAVVEAIKSKCSDSAGHLYQDHFKVALVLMVIDLYKSKSLDPAQVDELNKIIGMILGPDQNIHSCVQFYKGSQARPIVEKYQSALRDEAASLIDACANSPTIH